MNNQIAITLICEEKSGLLSFLVMRGTSIGLVYRKQRTKSLSKTKHLIAMTFYGKLDEAIKQSIQEFEKHPKVLKVEKIVVTDKK